MKVTGIDGLFDPKKKEKYKGYARGLLGRFADGGTLKFLDCFEQVKEKNTYWQCGILVLVWAYFISQRRSASQIAEFDVDQGSNLHNWFVDLINKDGPVPEPPRKVRKKTDKKPQRVKVDEEDWSLLSSPPPPPSPTPTSKKRQRETPERRKTPDREAKRLKNTN